MNTYLRINVGQNGKLNKGAIYMIELNILEILDEAIVSVKDTNYHEVQYGDEGCDGVDIGVVYSDIESVVHEIAENIQLKFNALTENIEITDQLNKCLTEEVLTRSEENKQLSQEKGELIRLLEESVDIVDELNVGYNEDIKASNYLNNVKTTLEKYKC